MKPKRLLLVVIIGLLSGGALVFVVGCVMAGVEPTTRQVVNSARDMYRLAVEARWQRVPGFRLTEATTKELCLAALSHTPAHLRSGQVPVLAAGICEGIESTEWIEPIDEATACSRANRDGEYWYLTVSARPESFRSVTVTLWYGLQLSDERREIGGVLAGGGPVLSCSRYGSAWTCRQVGSVLS